jgi:drug/metabolite transporter (DMT)-like permease
VIYIIFIFNVVLLVSGQLLWKVSADKIENFDINSISTLVVSPYFLSGAFLYVIATFIWIYILSKIPFSVAYPMQSLSYVIGMILAYLIFKETIVNHQWFGAGLIVLGVFFIAK